MTLEVLESSGNRDLATVFVLRTADGAHIECVESVQPPRPREEKWVLIVSTLKGCPVACPICDAGGLYKGRLSADEIWGQIACMVDQRYPSGDLGAGMVKIQFARMGDPVLNDAVLEVLTTMPTRYRWPGLVPSISTVAPGGRDAFFEALLRIKEAHYAGGRFQMQFSLHTSDEEARRALVPVRTWSFAQMAAFGVRFHRPGERKVTLNFASATDVPLDPAALAAVFSPEHFAVKLTPINPTGAAARNGMRSRIDPAHPGLAGPLVDAFVAEGFETILNIGEVEENQIGSNCGMFVTQREARRPAAA